MDIYILIRLLIRKIRYLLSIPILAGSLMFLLTKDQPGIYNTKASVFTAITSNASLDEMGASRVDYFATKTDYNNLLTIISSRNVIEETSLRLLARHLMLAKPVDGELSAKSFNEIQKIVPAEVKLLVVPGNEEATYKNFVAYLSMDKNNFLYGLINYNHPFYSYNAISKVKTVQVGSSDVFELAYQGTDPGIAYHTLRILIKVFLEKYSDLKKNQTTAVVGYFEKQLEKAAQGLSDAEDRLLNFNKANNIINYEEQTKHISSQQEKIDVKLQEELMGFKSSEAILQRLENETQSRFNVNLKTKDIMDARKALILVNKKLAEAELERGEKAQVTPGDENLKQLKAQLELDLQGKIDSLYVFARNSDGLSIETILEDWLKTVIEHEGSKAKYLAMESRSNKYEAIYSEFAPLGATLKRLEREISVKEKEYLEILHHLGLARLKQQNEAMMANMKILDAPHFPIEAESSKRKLYIIVVALFAFIFTLLGILVYELLDKTLKNASRFSRLSGLSIAGASVIAAKTSKIDVGLIMRNGLKPVLEGIISIVKAKKEGGPVFVQFISLWDGEGKSYLIDRIAKGLSALGFITQVYDFRATNNSFRLGSYEQLSDNEGAEIFLIEVPALATGVFNTSLFSTAHISFLVADAARVWSPADNYLLEKLQAQVGNLLQGILNKVYPHFMEELTGELPRERSKLRRFFKEKILKRIVAC